MRDAIKKEASEKLTLKPNEGTVRARYTSETEISISGNCPVMKDLAEQKPRTAERQQVR